MIHVAAAVLLLTLHTPDGYEVQINPEQITSLYKQRGKGNYTDKAQCLINLTDGKFVAVIEPCDEIEKRLELLK